MLLFVSCAAAAALILHLNRDGIFYYDEWIWFSGAAHADASTLFQSDNGHLVLAPRLIYQAVLSLFGTHYLPFRLISLSLVLTNSILLFALARRRVGDWLALAPAVLMMFLGSGWDVLVAGVGTNENLAIACGLGAFLALERQTLSADLLAGGLVTIGLASFSGELAIALGCIVLLVAEGRWRRIWVMVVPILLFAIWDLQVANSDSAQITVDHLGAIPYSMFDSASAAMAAATGVFPADFPRDLPAIDFSSGRPLAAVAIAGIGYLALTGSRPTPRFLAYATVVVTFWALIALANRDPGLGRYNLETLPFAFLALFELAAGHRLRGRHWIAVGAVLGFALLANVVALRNGAAILRYHGAADRATIAALELQREQVEASEDLKHTAIYQLAGFADATQSDLIYVTPADYLRAADEFGSATYPPTEIASAPEYAREPADRLLFGVLGIETRPVTPGVIAHNGRCTTLPPTRTGSSPIEVPPHGLVLRTSAADAQLWLRRFADFSTIAPLTVPARSVRLLSIPGDGLAQPWTIEVISKATVAACRKRQPAGSKVR